MDKERLEEFEAIRNYYVDDMRFRYGRNPYSDIKLLISTVEEQQKEIEAITGHYHNATKQKNKSDDDRIKLKKENSRLWEVLEFYADEDKYEFETIVSDCDIEVKSKILEDGGEEARQALKE
ncbi:hypothetical protein J22TS1_43960 [Siminovitchia terrae]|uniref:hypothetical protein n=1 Tax=Siminovitchia terrae TaxID=1914933 RepID=UPI001B16C445|nr:hypothetical protein [Siminovitchia terrae]GIN93345.1 hypothetical protein J22TS1_43960 [Siminovitchia terrae]